jgi:peroxiredoxin Q/BCP
MKAIIAATILLSALSTGMAQNLPQAGAIAPAVSLPSNDGRQVSLNDYKGKWVVLYFYPKDFTSGCTLEDTDAKVSEAYGSVKDYDGKTMSARNTFIINPEGKIARVFTGVKPQTHSEEVLQALAELKKS